LKQENYRGKHQQQVIESDMNYMDAASDLPASARQNRKPASKKGSSSSSQRRAGKDGLAISDDSGDE